MDETKRKRLAAVWLLFALLMGYSAVAGGLTASLGELLRLLVASLGVGLAAVYYLNPRGILDFGAK